MTCPSAARLAAAAAGEDALAIEHADACAHCSALVAEQREIIAAAHQLRAPRLTDERRLALAAEVMAAADVATEPRWRGGWIMLGAGAFAAAALAVVVLTASTRNAGAPELALSNSGEPTTVRANQVSHEAAPPDRFAEVVGSDADYARNASADRDVVELHDGELAIDARDREPVTIIAGATRVVIARSSAKIVARGGVIVTARVFAGTAEVTEGGKRQVIDAGEVWVPAKPVAPTVAASGFDAFRAGWQALREGRHADAVAAFDRATDPAVAEDAAFWAAVASERSGHRDEAGRRLATFIATFPSSPRIEAARTALERVTR